MKVLITASECSPLIKVGGIADVIGSLPIALKKLSIDVRVAIPYYKPLKDCIDNDICLKDSIKHLENFTLQYGSETLEIGLYVTNIPNTDIPVYLIYNDKHISNGGIYYSPEYMPSPEEELTRFAIFTKALAKFFSYTNNVFNPDIIHCNDWHTGMLPQLLQESSRYNTQRKPIKTVFTIHNLAYQGFSKLDVADKLGLNIKNDPILKWDSEDQNIDFLLQGIVGANYVTTVSSRYAQEIQTQEFGEGLEDILRGKSGKLMGVLNGISYEVFNPLTDQYISKNFSISNWIENKVENKTNLQEELGLNISAEKPLIGLVTRLASQKGIDVVCDIIPEIVEKGFQIVILGTGDPLLETKLKELNENDAINKDFKALLEFSEAKARKIYAAADLFLIPSRYEPSGLTQMIAMKYGSLPVVRATGGLYDTVDNEITGFTFENLTRVQILETLSRALNFYINNEQMWRKMVNTAMKQDFSWNESAKKYVLLYNKALTD